jgi:hypothetical protein
MTIIRPTFRPTTRRLALLIALAALVLATLGRPRLDRQEARGLRFWTVFGEGGWLSWSVSLAAQDQPGGGVRRDVGVQVGSAWVGTLD